MLENYEFRLFVSQEGYPEKPTKEAVSKIVFEPQQLTIEDALQLAVQGNAFCYNFNTNGRSTLPIKQKTTDNFSSTSVIFFDFDKMDMSMHKYIDSIPYKPSFAYTSYSNGENNQYRYRLVYALRQTIYSEENYNEISNAIANANNFVTETKQHGGWDVRSVSQFYYGTKENADTYIGDFVYPIELFQKYIVYDNKPVQDTPCRNAISGTDNTDVKVDKDFLNDFNKLSSGKLINTYFEKYHDAYLQSLSTELTLSEDEMYFIYPEDYVAVPRKRNGKYTTKWNIGEDRKKKLWISAQVMLYNQPDMTIENLLYNLNIERKWYYENSDNKITNDVIYNTAINAYKDRITLKSSNHGTFKVNKEFWEEQGISVYQAMGYIRREMHVKEILPYIDKYKSIKENHINLISNGFSISLRTLQRMVKSGDIEIIKHNPPTTLLSNCHVDFTIQKIIELIRENAKITTGEMAKIIGKTERTIKNRIKKVRGILIDRVGNNCSGKWVLIGDAACEDADTGVKEKDPCMGSLNYSTELSSVEGLFSTPSQYIFNPADMAAA